MRWAPPLAETVHILLRTLDKEETVGHAGFLVEDHDVDGRQVRRQGRILVPGNTLSPDELEARISFSVRLFLNGALARPKTEASLK